MTSYILCPVCLSLIKNENKYLSHIKKQHSTLSLPKYKRFEIIYDNKSSYTCLYCKKTFSSLVKSKHHCIEHLKQERNNSLEQKFKCPYCGIKDTKSNLNTHFENQHNLSIMYDDILEGRKKRELTEQEDKLIPQPVYRTNSDNVNCPVCQIIISKDTYFNHFRTEHFDKVQILLKNNNISISTYSNGYVCPESKVNGTPHKGVFVNGSFNSKKLPYKIPKFYCYTCGKNYITEEKYPKETFTSKEGTFYYNYPNLFSDKIQEYQKQTVQQPQNKSSQSFSSEKPVQNNIVNAEVQAFENIQLIVYDKFPKTICKNGSHNEEPIIIKTKDFLNKEISINAFYCDKCHKFFTNYETINKYFGFIKPLIPIHCEYTENGRRTFSELSLYGYNVDANGLGYSPKSRQKLLKDILDNGLIRKTKIINLLKSFIDFNGRNKNMQHAKECWRNDLDFVSSYTPHNTNVIRPEHLTIIYKNKKV